MKQKKRNRIHSRNRGNTQKQPVARKKRPARIAKKRSPQYDRLTARGKATYDRTTNLISALRRGEGPYTELLQKHHIASRTARESAGGDLRGGGRGKPVRASKADRRVRDVWFPTSVGDMRFRTRNSHDATTLSDYYHDRDQLLHDKMNAHQFELKWRDVQVAGRKVFTDVGQIFRMADAGELKIEDLYASTGGAL